jgi:hypothetical protein
MVDCSVILEEIAGLNAERRFYPVMPVALRETSDAFAKAAGLRAKAEAQVKVDSYLTQTRSEHESKWSDRFASLLIMQENGDWIDDCRRFERSQGILTPRKAH